MSEEKAKAMRFNKNKLSWSLVDFESMESMVEVLMFGAKKYERHNWKSGLDVDEVCESLARDLFAFMNGEDKDKESGLSHIGHIQCNSMFLSYMMKHKPELDKRYINPKQ